MSKEFQIAVLGATGGPSEANLTSFLVSKSDRSDFIALDAGTLLTGIEKLLEKNRFALHIPSGHAVSAIDFLKKRIKAYCITHPHLDHVAGLVLSSQVDDEKPIFALPETLGDLSEYIFNNRIWPNFGDQGAAPCLSKYRYQPLIVGQKRAVIGTELTVEAFLLAHSPPVYSTAFLVEGSSKAILFFGDTTSDDLSRKNYLEQIWRKVAPLVREKRLAAILIECSYSEKENVPHSKSHLDSERLFDELSRLAKFSMSDLSSVTLVVIHRKEGEYFDEIEKEIRKKNHLELELVFPKQGDLFQV